jgi:cytoskeleton protein RodZ
MSSERADQPATPGSQQGNPGQNPGQILAAQREAMGWTVEQVADQLKLAVRQVVALEAGDYASLPSPAVTRGFVRAYAKLMKLDPAPLVSQIAIETVPTVDSGSVHAPRRAQPASFSQSRFPSHGKRSKLPLGLIGAVVVVAAAGAAVWHFGLLPGAGQHAETSVTTPAPGGSPADAAAGSTVEPLQNPAVPLISVPGSTDAASAPAAGAPAVNTPAQPAAATTTPAAAPATTAAVAPAPVTPAAAAPAPVATPAATTPAAAPAPAGANALVLNVREDSWIEVRPAKGGAALISRLVKGGSTETVNVDGPVRVVVGNPTGVTATLRGTAVALPPVPGKTISRISLQ